MRLQKVLASFLVLLLLAGSATAQAQLSCRQIIDRMLDSIKAIKTQTFDVKATERVDGRLLFAESHVKIAVHPRKIYFHNPEKGIEIIWVQGQNKGNAIVHSRSVPLMNFDLDPYGSIMRKDQHHTIFDLGSPYIGTVIASTIVKAPGEFDKHFAYAGTLRFANRDCYQILISYPEYKYITYITGKDETVTSIAQKFGTSDFKIRYKNGLSSYFGNIRPGKELQVPVPYSNRGIILIDKATFLPLSVKIYDEEGLFEAYEFYNMQTNIRFAHDEFSTSYKGYSF